MLLRFYIILIAVIFSSQAYAINLTAQVDRTNISTNESVRLIVAVDETANESIDFSQLKSQFEIINQQRSQRQQIANGKISSLTQWILILAPKESGNALIPSFRYKSVFSNPIEITIGKASAQNDSQKSDVFLEITADKTSAHVQEQILLKTRLYYKIALSNYDASEFSLKDTTIELVNETTYKTTFNNERYQVLELIHALYPQTSGELLIPKLRWRLEKPSRSFFDRSSNPYLFAQSNSLKLSIKPIPSISTATHWLPSTAITLEPQWQQPPQQAKVGEPLNLSLTLTANGLSASQLPEINLPTVENLNIFKERSITDDVKSGNGIIGSRKSEFTIIPKETGALNLPEITLKWWNVATGKEELLRLKEQSLIVSKSNLRVDNLPEIPTLNNPVPDESSLSIHPSFWRIIFISFTLLLVTTIVFFYKFNRHRNTQTTGHNLLKKPSMRMLEISIQQSVERNNLGQLPSLLIQWGRIYRDDQNINTTEKLANKIPELHSYLQDLNHALYGTTKDHNWQASNIVSIIQGINKTKAVKRGKELLKPLYQ